MTTLHFRVTALIASFACLAVATSRAPGAIFITPASGAYDTWVRQTNPGGIFVTDTTNCVWRQEGAPDASARICLNQFNLSSVTVPITSAFVLFAQQDATNLSQTNFAMAPAAWVNSSVLGGDLSTLNYNDYAFFVQPVQTSFQSFGGGAFAANTPKISSYGAPVGADGSIVKASAADLAVLNTLRTGDGIINMVFAANSGTGRNFLSTEGGKPFTLVLNYIDGDYNADNIVTLADYSILKAHWYQPVTLLTNGDATGDEFVDIADFVAFKKAYLAQNPGGGAEIPQPVPEPSTLLLLAAAVPTWLLFRRRRNRKSNMNANLPGHESCIS